MKNKNNWYLLIPKSLLQNKEFTNSDISVFGLFCSIHKFKFPIATNAIIISETLKMPLRTVYSAIKKLKRHNVVTTNRYGQLVPHPELKFKEYHKVPLSLIHKAMNGEVSLSSVIRTAGTIESFSKMKKGCVLSDSGIAERIDRSVATVQRHLKILESVCAIVIEQTATTLQRIKYHFVGRKMKIADAMWVRDEDTYFLGVW